MRRWRTLALVAAIGAACPVSAVAGDGSDFPEAPDHMFVVSRLGACTGEPDFGPENDVDQDGCVTSADLGALGANLQTTVQLLEIDLSPAIDVWFVTARLDMFDMFDMFDMDAQIGASRAVIALWTVVRSASPGS